MGAVTEPFAGVTMAISGNAGCAATSTCQPFTPTAAPQLPLSKNALGQYTAGFGVINATAAVNTAPTLNGASRAGTLIARFSF